MKQITIFFFLVASVNMLFAQGKEKRQERRSRRHIADDPQMWNYTIINFWDNPALTGINGQHNISLEAGNLHPDNIILTGYDCSIKPFKKDKFSLGLGAYYTYSMDQGFGGFNAYGHSLGLSGSFRSLLKGNTQIDVGLSLGLTHERTESYDVSYFESVYGDSVLTPGYPYGESFFDEDPTITKLTAFGPLNLGAWFQGKNYFAGLTLNNLSRSNESHIGEKQASPLDMIFTVGYHFNIKEKATITPSMQYWIRGFLLHRWHPRLTVTFSKSRILLGMHYVNHNLSGIVGVDLFTYIQASLSAGYRIQKISGDRVNGGYAALNIRVHFSKRNKKNK